MANETTKTQTSDAMDYPQHEATWKLFTELVKWGVIGCAVLMVVLYFAINP